MSVRTSADEHKVWHPHRVYVKDGDFYIPMRNDELESVMSGSGRARATLSVRGLELDIPLGDKGKEVECDQWMIDTWRLLKVTRVIYSNRMNRSEVQMLNTIAFVSKYSSDLADWLSSKE